MTLLSIADSSRKTNSAIKGSSSFYPNPENLLEGRIKVLFRFTFFPASLESVMTDTKWRCRMSKNIWREKLINVVFSNSFFSFGCLFVSRKIKKNSVHTSLAKSGEFKNGRKVMSPDVHMTVNSSTFCMRCEVNYTIWAEETDSCSQVMQQVPQLNKKNALPRGLY